MPSARRRHAEWTPERLQRQARGIGRHTEALILAVLARRPHPEQGFRTGFGVLRLFRGLDPVRAEAVSLRAVEVGALFCASVASILKHRLDRRAFLPAADGTPFPRFGPRRRALRQAAEAARPGRPVGDR